MWIIKYSGRKKKDMFDIKGSLQYDQYLGYDCNVMWVDDLNDDVITFTSKEVAVAFLGARINSKFDEGSYSTALKLVNAEVVDYHRELKLHEEEDPYS